MPLHLTKVAFGLTTLEQLHERWAARAADAVFELNTRYLPKRHVEIGGAGSLYWILKHRLVARSPIIGFGEMAGGRTAIRLDPVLVLVDPRPKRAHQGWRYLEGDDAPPDLTGVIDLGDAMPARLIGELSALALL